MNPIKIKGKKTIKLTSRIFYILLAIGITFFIFGIAGAVSLLPVTETYGSYFLWWIITLSGPLFAPLGFIILVFLWKYKENEIKIKSKTTNKQIRVQSFVEIVYKGSWLRWVFTIFTIWFLFWSNTGGFEGSLIRGSIYATIICSAYSLLLFIPIYLLDCYLKQKEQHRYINKITSQNSNHSFQDMPNDTNSKQ